MIQISISNGNPIKVTVDHRPNERRNSVVGAAAEACAEALRELIASSEEVPLDSVKQALIEALSPKVQGAEAPLGDEAPTQDAEAPTQEPPSGDEAPVLTAPSGTTASDSTADGPDGPDGTNEEGAKTQESDAPADASDASKPAAE